MAGALALMQPLNSEGRNPSLVVVLFRNREPADVCGRPSPRSRAVPSLRGREPRGRLPAFRSPVGGGGCAQFQAFSPVCKLPLQDGLFHGICLHFEDSHYVLEDTLLVLNKELARRKDGLYLTSLA